MLKEQHKGKEFLKPTPCTACPLPLKYQNVHGITQPWHAVLEPSMEWSPTFLMPHCTPSTNAGQGFYSPERPFMHFPVCCWFLISSEFEPGRSGSQWALESPVSSAVMLLYHPSALMLLYHPRLNLEKSSGKNRIRARIEPRTFTPIGEHFSNCAIVTIFYLGPLLILL